MADGVAEAGADGGVAELTDQVGGAQQPKRT
jgi:hypothetical protein